MALVIIQGYGADPSIPSGGYGGPNPNPPPSTRGPLVTTLGYGPRRLAITAGYGDGDPVIVEACHPGFLLDSVGLLDTRTLRVRFTEPPATGTGPESATLIASYTLAFESGEPDPTILVASIPSDDPEVVDLHFAADLVPGEYLLTVASSVQSAAGAALTPPTSLPFAVADLPVDAPGNGAADLDCFQTFLHNLHPAYRTPPVWRALARALSRGDCTVNQAAERILAQLSIASASGPYLERRAGDVGVPRPRGTGISDEDYRSLAEAMADKLTLPRFWRLAEVFYGPTAVRAYADSTLVEPFALVDGTYLDVELDGGPAMRLMVVRRDFRILRRALAEELAAAWTRQLRASGSNAYAVAQLDPRAGVMVRIFSGVRGLRSSVRVAGGTVQPALDFADVLFTGSVPDPAATWTIELVGGGVARLHIASLAVFDLSLVEVGDYVVVSGIEWLAQNRGSFPVVDVHAGGPGQTWVDILNPLASAQIAVAQCGLDSLKFYRGRRRTIYDAPEHALIWQDGGTAFASIAATARIVGSGPGRAAYPRLAAPVGVLSVERAAGGEVTVDTSSPHGLSVGALVELEDPSPSLAPPLATPGVPANQLGGGVLVADEQSGVSSLSPLTTWDADEALASTLHRTVRAPSGQVFVVGGIVRGSLVLNRQARTFTVAAELDEPEGEGYSYRWRAGAGNGLIPALGHDLAPLEHAARAGQVLSIGGYQTTPWANFQLVNYAASATRHTAATYGEEVQTPDQLTTGGILAGLTLYATARPVSGDTVVLKDASTTRTYAFGAGGDVTVAIGADAAACLVSLAAAISGDSVWGASYSTSLAHAAAPGGVFVFELAVGASRSSLRSYGTWATQAHVHAVAFASAGAVQVDYAGGTDTALPTSDPGFGTAGFHRGAGGLRTGEIHRVVSSQLYESWTGSSWSVGSVNHVTTVTTTGAPLALADAAVASVSAADGGWAMSAGGSLRLNEATTYVQVYSPSADTFAPQASLKEPRMQARALRLGGGQVLVAGGRRPFSSRPASLGFTTWDFEDGFFSATFAGRALLDNSAGHPRPMGKAGWGVHLTSPLPALGGSDQTSLNAALLGAYTLVGWMTAGAGCVLRNGNFPRAGAADNTLVAFGVDPSDSKFFLRWQHGSSLATVEKKTTATVDDLMPGGADLAFPRYHQFGITKTAGTTCTFTLYVDGLQAGQWTDTGPTAGGSGRWSFGDSHSAGDVSTIAGFTGCVDEVGFSPSVLAASQVRSLYLNEVGVAYDHPGNPTAMPVGKVLGSCELVDATGSLGRTGGMGSARFAHGLCLLPDGRALAVGGIGYPASDPPPDQAAQRSFELRTAEVYDPENGTWSSIAPTVDPHSYPVCEVVGRRVYVAGGFASPRAEYLDLDTMAWGVCASQLPSAAGITWGSRAGADVLVLPGGEDIEAGFETTPARSVHARAGEEVLATGGLAGVHRVTSVPTSTSLTFDTPDFPQVTSASAFAITAYAAPADLQHRGPYAVDPGASFTARSVATTTTSRLEEGAGYPQVGVVDASLFDDGPGAVVFDLGSASQVGPVPYLGRVGTAALALDARFTFPRAVPAGARVRMAARGAVEPAHPETAGLLYATGSAAGRAAAEATLLRASAAGIELDISIRYPSDRGLGAEGAPTSGSPRLSEVVEVYAGDPVDVELEARRAE